MQLKNYCLKQECFNGTKIS